MWARLFLFLLPSVLFAAQNLDSYLVTVRANDVTKPSIYHCYADKTGRLWMPKSELEALGFPAAKEFVYQDKILYALADYEAVEVDLNKESLTLVLHTPIEWEKGGDLTKVPLYNGKIRPLDPGFFLITI